MVKVLAVVSVLAVAASPALAQSKAQTKEPKSAATAKMKMTVVAADEVVVNVSYNAKGAVVDGKNDILVFLFDHPEPTADSRPLTVQAVATNGGTATFKGVTTPTVYIVAVYDEKANYDGKSGPPPAGTPLATYGKAGKPIAVKPGTNVTMSFNDARRWK